jgi:nitrogen fixation/metabolism regulation signal transduction histidine kinase
LKLDQPLQMQKQEEKSLHWDLIRFFKSELEIIEESDNYIEISLEELTEKVKALRKMLERIEKHCFKYDLEAEELAYHSNTKQLLKYFNNLLEENEDLDHSEDHDDETDEDDAPEPVIVKYSYDRTSVERIRLLTVAEFETETGDL